MKLTFCSQVQDSADKVAEPQRAAQAKEAAVKAAARQKYVHSGPARKSSRAGAQRTKAKLQAQAGEDSEEEQASASSQSHGSDDDDHSKANDTGNMSRKRRRSVQEADFDPAGTTMLAKCSNQACTYNNAWRHNCSQGRLWLAVRAAGFSSIAMECCALLKWCACRFCRGI